MSFLLNKENIDLILFLNFPALLLPTLTTSTPSPPKKNPRHGYVIQHFVGANLFASGSLEHVSASPCSNTGSDTPCSLARAAVPAPGWEGQVGSFHQARMAVPTSRKIGKESSSE